MNELVNILVSCSKDGFNYPVLDDLYIDLADTRLSVFKNDTKWILVIEKIGYFIQGQFAVYDLYAYGNTQLKNGLIYTTDEFITINHQNILVDENGRFSIEPFDKLSFKIWNENVKMQLSPNDFEQAKINFTRYSPSEFVRMISFKFKDKLFLNDQDIMNKLNEGRLDIFYRTNHWYHSNENPSLNPFFRDLDIALQHNDPLVIRPFKPNTHWQNWGTHIEEGDY
ncbi:hypothetical protein IC620_13145 [Hazenella sp. IB182357]|uniref:Uncharacterized protein n=1 Tax=Polycladospora coralii TaxID=2771432 RepID=A0A926NDB1_9BACL|nr:hypothetical protein [Polycladospora coralii]MBD1373295.1 hypothetical protein [Polycladospora coralii]